MSLLRWGCRFLGLLLGWCLRARIRSAMALMTAATVTRTRTTRSMSVGTMSTLSAGSPLRTGLRCISCFLLSDASRRSTEPAVRIHEGPDCQS
jgi:hypothetical protein